MKIRVIDRDGNKHELEGDPNSTLMEILRDADLAIEAACGGCCACATCHVYINDQWLEKISPKDDDEESTEEKDETKDSEEKPSDGQNKEADTDDNKEKSS